MTSNSPYVILPSYADVDYIDGKLRVARSIISNTTSEKTKRAWQINLDHLLEQRSMLLEVERGDYG